MTIIPFYIQTNTLSDITHYTSVAVSSKADLHHIVDIKFVLLGTRVLMAVILTDTGAIKETIIKFDADINEAQIENLNYMFNYKLRGVSLNNIKQPFEQYIKEEMRGNQRIS